MSHRNIGALQAMRFAEMSINRSDYALAEYWLEVALEVVRKRQKHGLSQDCLKAESKRVKTGNKI